MFLPLVNAQPISMGLRAGGRWLNWARSTPILPVWESPFVAGDHLQRCKPDPDVPSLQEANLDDRTIYTADSLVLFAEGKPFDVVPIPPGMIGPDGPHSVINDPGFEAVQVGDGKFRYRPEGSPWTFAGTSGITANRSGFTVNGPAAPEGGQVAFLQEAGSISQTISGWTIGTYLLTFSAAQRPSQAARQDFAVLVDDAVVGTFTPTTGSYQRHATNPFAITAGSHVLTFRGLNTAGGDNTAVVDSIQQFLIS